MKIKCPECGRALRTVPIPCRVTICVYRTCRYCKFRWWIQVKPESSTTQDKYWITETKDYRYMGKKYKFI